MGPARRGAVVAALLCAVSGCVEALRVCVTGANGFVGAELVRQLLYRGFHVHGTVRSLADRGKTAFLRRMAEEAGGQLDLFEADLRAPGSFDRAVQGCTYVFHVASPVVYNPSDPQEDLVRPAVEGVENVLRSVAKMQESPSSPFRRLVLTSTTGTIWFQGATPKNGKRFTEEDWNESVSLDFWPYFYSKVLAERRAWSLAEELAVDVVTVHPAYVWGPPPSPQLASTLNLQRLLGVLKGEGQMYSFAFPACDIRDVAAVHIKAAMTPGAKGRYLVSTRQTVSPSWIAKTIRDGFPGRFKNMREADASVASEELIDTSRTEKDLGYRLTPPERTLTDTIQALADLGLLQGA